MSGGIIILAIIAVFFFIKNRIAKTKLMNGVPFAYEKEVINEERETRWAFWFFIFLIVFCLLVAR
jgi:uncharacterized membrane protein